ncbi:TolC family protein [Variovorax beijingensis]|uniref:TolC family protein n=1 Tax=Variovorax beijingensis TaxID=2496117 RepID=A0ABX9ZX34_9BURK|nr:TolC family protein [Variovorax beijingensis]RSZ29089.1 TolC family protein [Variovorax beijingensis]
MVLRLVPTMLLAIGLLGCATSKHLAMPDLLLPAVYAAAGSSAPLPPTEPDTWWTSYGDAQLQLLVDRALEGGTDARLALARLDEARAVRAQALTAYDPQGRVQASAERTQSRSLGDDPSPPVAQARNLALPISWEIDLFGRRSAARDAADADLAAARFAYEASRSSLAAQVAQTLFEARGLTVQLEDARANERIQGELLELIERRFERGLAAGSDADRVGAELARSRAQRMALEADLYAARRALLVLTGRGLLPVDDLQLGDTLEEPPAMPDAVPGDLLRRRPDVREARARIDSASASVRLAELDFFPTLTLHPSLGLSQQRGSINTSLSFWTLGLGLDIPVLDRPRLRAALDLQGARVDQALIRYETAVQTAFAEADRAFVRLRAAQQRVEILNAGEVRARRAFDATHIRYRRGLGDLQTLLDAEAAWRATRSALTTARLDRLLQSVQTFKALGGGWSPSTSPSRSSS